MLLIDSGQDSVAIIELQQAKALAIKMGI